MKTLIKTCLILTMSIFVFSCSNNDDTPPPPVNEEEIITTLVVTLQPVAGGTSITLTSRDLDGDGPNDPVITISDNFEANTNYNGSVAFLNETESPAEDITEEVNAESEEHQVFFITSGSLDADFEYLNFDSNSNPLGTLFSMSTGAASNGNLNVVLRHEPNKPNDGSLADAGGETDLSVSFNVIIE